MTIAIVGRTGSGKTFAAKGLIETDLGVGLRVCVVDPTGAWWGLRLRPDGATPAFPVVIFGGEHGDVPVASDQGDALAEAILDGRAIQSVVDVSEMSGAEQFRFLTAFFERLYSRNRGPLTLVMDEADVMAPQNPLPEQRRLQGAVNKIVRRGRIKGFRPIMITQRPAVLDKSVLSQIDTLIAMRLTSPQDRKAIEEWVKGNADAVQAREVLDSLASLPRGEGWFWAPHAGVLERRAFPPIATFDSSRTPEPGEMLREVSLLTLPDVDALRAAFLPAEARKVVDFGAGDAALRAEIARLGREMVEAEKRGYARGEASGASVWYRRGFEDAFKTIETSLASVNKHENIIAGLERWRQVGAMEPCEQDDFAPSVVAAPEPKSVNPIPQTLAPGQPRSGSVSPTVGRILDVIHAAYPTSLTFKAAAMRAGASARSSAYRKYQTEVLASAEIVVEGDQLRSPHGPGSGVVVGDPIEAFAAKLAPSWAAMLRTIASAHKPMTRDQIAKASNVSPTSSGLSAGLRELEAMDLIVKRADGRFEIAAELMRSGQ